MGVIFSSGFEDNFTSWTAIGNDFMTDPVIDVGTVHSGLKSCKTAWDGTGYHGGWAWKVINETHVFMRCYVNLSALPAVNEEIYFVWVQTSGGDIGLDRSFFGLQNNAGNYRWTSRSDVGGWWNWVYSAVLATPPTAGEWFYFEVERVIDAVNGLWRVWAMNSPQATPDIENTGLNTTSFGNITIAKVGGASAIAGGAINVYIDDVVVNNTDWNGPLPSTSMTGVMTGFATIG